MIAWWSPASLWSVFATLCFLPDCPELHLFSVCQSFIYPFLKEFYCDLQFRVSAFCIHKLHEGMMMALLSPKKFSFLHLLYSSAAFCCAALTSYFTFCCSLKDRYRPSQKPLNGSGRVSWVLGRLSSTVHIIVWGQLRYAFIKGSGLKASKSYLSA